MTAVAPAPIAVPIVLVARSITLAAAVVTYSAKPPGRVMPIIVRFEQRLSRPCTQ